MYDLVKLVCSVLNETGGILVTAIVQCYTERFTGDLQVNMGYPDLGMFVLEALKEGKKAISDGNNHADVEVVLERVRSVFFYGHRLILFHSWFVLSQLSRTWLLSRVNVGVS
jgi:hypothetical protein